MASRAWKEAEKGVADLLGGKRVSNTALGLRSADVETPAYWSRSRAGRTAGVVDKRGQPIAPGLMPRRSCRWSCCTRLGSVV